MNIARIFSRRDSKRVRKSRARSGRRRCGFESLEPRQLLAASIYCEDGNWYINADPLGDRVKLFEQYRLVARGQARAEVVFQSTTPAGVFSLVIDRNDVEGNGIIFNGSNANDTFENLTPFATIVNGNGGNDVLRGGSAADTIDGGTGHDTVYGGAGSDTLIGGYGNDKLYGEKNNDKLYGGSDNDTMYGGDGDDYLDAYHGNDYLDGEVGNDTLYGGLNDDTLIGGYGNDTLHGQWGNDKLYGGSDNDTMYGGDGNDYLDAYHGADLLDGQAGNDTLYGGLHDDRLYGGAGNDVLDGQWGNDKLYGGAGADTMSGGDGNDILVSLDSSIADTLYGNAGDDSFWSDREPLGIYFMYDQVMDGTTFELKQNLHFIETFANGADKTLDGDQIADPVGGIVHTATGALVPVGQLSYNNFNNRPLFSSAGPHQLDVEQNGLGDCWLLASLGNAARTNPNSIRQTVVELGDGTYAVELAGKFYRVDGDLPVWPVINTFRFAGFGQQQSIWVPIVEKAYALHRTSTWSPPRSYGGLDGAWPDEAFQAIGCTGLVTKSFTVAADALKHIASEFNSGKAVVVNIDAPSTGSPLIRRHTYMVERINYKVGTATPISVVLRNPHRVDGAGNDGVNDGLVTVTGQQLVASMYRTNGIQSAFVA